jgi:hypothetical protein
VHGPLQITPLDYCAKIHVDVQLPCAQTHRPGDGLWSGWGVVGGFTYLMMSCTSTPSCIERSSMHRMCKLVRWCGSRYRGTRDKWFYNCAHIQDMSGGLGGGVVTGNNMEYPMVTPHPFPPTPRYFPGGVSVRSPNIRWPTWRRSLGGVSGGGGSASLPERRSFRMHVHLSPRVQ